MKVHRHHSAYVRVASSDAGLALVTFAGPMCRGVYVGLRSRAIGDMIKARSFVCDIRSMCPLDIDLSRDLCEPKYGHPNAPGAILVDNGQALQIWSEYALKVSRYGLSRVVFTSPESAFSWAERRIQAANGQALQP